MKPQQKRAIIPDILSNSDTIYDRYANTNIIIISLAGWSLKLTSFLVIMADKNPKNIPIRILNNDKVKKFRSDSKISPADKLISSLVFLFSSKNLCTVSNIRIDTASFTMPSPNNIELS
jgi:hypothetical protein